MLTKATVRPIQLTLPKLVYFPIFAIIPFSIKITTTTKVMKHTDASPDNELFPAPPATPSAFRFILTRNAVMLGTDGYRGGDSEDAGALGDIGPQASSEDSCRVRSQVVPAVWTPLSDDEKLPAGKQRGTWKQESVFTSEFVLKCPPAFWHANFSVKVFPWLSSQLTTGFEAH